jgi:type I restriction enzyme M protein
MSERISQSELESYLWGAATLLRGTIDAGEYKAFIFPLLFLKRLSDVFDEEYAVAFEESGGDKAYASLPEQHRFQVPNGAHWRDVRRATTNVGKALASAMREIEVANPRLFGVFGDAPWTNKERLPDSVLRDLIEHYSMVQLNIESVPEDELGVAYEFLIKKFADDSGHTAAEFYTNRTLVHLMTQMLEIQPGESVYDPTCGSGGMLLSAANELRRQGKEHRSLKLFGQERNLTTSAIARMNLFLHGIEDFDVVRGDTLANPTFLEGDRLRRFDVVLANPPYSIKQWDRAAWQSDKWGRNVYGTPPQGRADYAFWQHILCSMDQRTGRCAILFPHGVLFRDEEREMRERIVAADAIEAVIGLGPNLFYNSPMEACVVVCRSKKAASRSGRVLFVDAVNEVTRERAQSFLTPANIARIVGIYRTFEEEPGFSGTATLAEIASNSSNLSIPLYVKRDAGAVPSAQLPDTLRAWRESASDLRVAAGELFELVAGREVAS